MVKANGFQSGANFPVSSFYHMHVVLTPSIAAARMLAYATSGERWCNNVIVSSAMLQLATSTCFIGTLGWKVKSSLRCVLKTNSLTNVHRMHALNICYKMIVRFIELEAS